MAKSLKVNVDIQAWVEDVSKQFRNLDTKDPSSWPVVPRFGIFFLIAAACVTALWFLWLTDKKVELTVAQESEVKLREDYKTKLAKAVNLEALKKQREQVQQYVTQLEKQLPSKAEMDKLLSDINQAGVGRSLQFELFKPGDLATKEYYAELPIALRVTGRYHDLGAFAGDIANLSRIVTLVNVRIAPLRDSALAMDATAKTFRYLDSDEVEAQRKAAQGAKKK
jgi:type IV pilus assembly protein PilO